MRERQTEMNPASKFAGSRRQFISQAAGGLALPSLLSSSGLSAEKRKPGEYNFPSHTAKAKRVIYLFQSGGPPQMDLFDYKPYLKKVHGQEVPDSVIGGQGIRVTPAGQTSFPVVRSVFNFKQHGESRATISEVMPYLGEVADDICFIKSLHTDAINHNPAITFLQTGVEIVGRPAMGAWISYGLGSNNETLPSFFAMSSGDGQPIYKRLWSAGFLPPQHQGELFQSVKTPEMSDLSDEPESTFALYGKEARRPGTYANHVLTARRLVEHGCRFVQLFHRGWDTHSNLPAQLSRRCRETDQATMALLKDLKLRGLLDDTLVIWGGEFGRTVYCQGEQSPENYGRDHHPHCFTVWMAGGGAKPGLSYGKTDDYGYNIVENPVSVHDFHATILHLLGIDHEKLTFKFKGRAYRLTDTRGKVIKGLLA